MGGTGAINVRIRSKPNALPGHFVVSSVWACSEQNLGALKQVPEEERALYRKRPIGSCTPDRSKVGAIRQWVTGRASA
ncbi:hypothetical protein [Variovorax rhizosphaerae]|uniref:Uncharacterized protein n=1 Tax=Variovorax rhizosphaerae TaxID=1836200 RepID=A0ABU8WH20_9BURK